MASRGQRALAQFPLQRGWGGGCALEPHQQQAPPHPHQAFSHAPDPGAV